MKKIDDPELIAQLNAGLKQVNDPELIARLNSTIAEEPEQPNVFQRGLGKVQDFSEGIGYSGLKTYYGLKDLVGLGEEEDKEKLQWWKDAASESGWGKAGEIGGDIAQLAIPGTAGVKVASKLPTTLRYAQGLKAGTRLGADVAGSAAMGYSQLPEGERSRAENAAMYGAGALGGAAAGKVLSVAGQGIKGSKTAQRLRESGVKLTAGQQNEFLRRIEGYANLIPFMAKGVERSRDASFNSLVRTMQKQADPKGRMFNNSAMMDRLTPKQINKELYETFQAGYDAAWGAARPTDDIAESVMTTLTANTKKLTKNQRKQIDNLIDEVIEKASTQGTTLKDIDDVLRFYWKNPGKDPAKVKAFNESIKSARDNLRKNLPDESREFLKKLDGKYYKYRVLREASTTAGAERKALVDINDLQAGNRAVVSKFQRSMGDEPYGTLLDDYAAARGNPKEPLLGWARAITKELPDVAQTRRLQNVLGGNAWWQGPTRNVMQKLQADHLRGAYSGARMGAALIEEEED